MKKKNKGFTLIELLAVIVILGLLMAIAIPSVTKYITQSRKKTLTTTIDNYIGALTNQVNDMEYVFTGTNTIYAVPIECIALERGGTNPFGEWHQASNSYWAYVLVQYDDATSSYTYGFTFKDSAGYGLYPTTSEKLKESGSQILTDLNLSRPTTGKITNITVKDNWTGFEVTNDTNLIVLKATSEGQTGNGTTTCTLCQKGKNYDDVNTSVIKTFEIYINGSRRTFQFEEGMTWADFATSKYNTLPFSVSTHHIGFQSNGEYYHLDYSCPYVTDLSMANKGSSSVSQHEPIFSQSPYATVEDGEGPRDYGDRPLSDFPCYVYEDENGNISYVEN